MKVAINYEFMEMVVPPRCRKARPENGKDMVEVKIKEITEAEAPVAFSVTELYTRNRLVRLYKDCLYRQVQFRDGAPFETKHMINWQYAIGAFSSNYNHTRAENIASIKVQSKKYLVIGENVYEQCGEPYYYGLTFGLGGNHGGTGFFVGYAEPKGRSMINGFSPLDRDAAIEGVCKIALRRGDTKSVDRIRTSEYYTIDVFMPEASKRKYNNQKV